MVEHARLFAEHGHEVTVHCREGSSNDLRIRLRLLPDANNAADLSLALEPEFARQDVVIMHNVPTMPFYLALTEALWELGERLSGVRFIAWVHDLAACNSDYQLPALDSPPWSFIALAHPRYRYVAVSEVRRRQFEKLTGHSCRVIPNGLNPGRLLGLTDAVADIARAHRLLEREIVLLHPARLLRRKNVELGLRVAAALKTAGWDCAYVVTGAPDPHQEASRAYASELRELRSELGMKADALFVHEERAVDERDLASFYALSDALFFPSRQEGFGLPLLEAALHRLPIFCAGIEPLDSLLAHGVSCFSLDAEPAQIALQIAARLESLDAWQSRNQVRRQYAWPVVYRNHIAPLLTSSEIPALL